MTDERIDICDVCAGNGKPISGKPCICGGAGTLQAEMQGFRTLALAQDRVINAFRMMLRCTGVSGTMLDTIEKEAMNNA